MGEPPLDRRCYRADGTPKTVYLERRLAKIAARKCKQHWYHCDEHNGWHIGNPSQRELARREKQQMTAARERLSQKFRVTDL